MFGVTDPRTAPVPARASLRNRGSLVRLDRGKAEHTGSVFFFCVSFLLPCLGCSLFSLGLRRLTERAVFAPRLVTFAAKVVAGGGAIEMELSKALRDHSKTIKGKQQLIMSSYAKALEIIPRQLVRPERERRRGRRSCCLSYVPGRIARSRRRCFTPSLFAPPWWDASAARGLVWVVVVVVVVVVIVSSIFDVVCIVVREAVHRGMATESPPQCSNANAPNRPVRTVSPLTDAAIDILPSPPSACRTCCALSQPSLGWYCLSLEPCHIYSIHTVLLLPPLCVCVSVCVCVFLLLPNRTVPKADNAGFDATDLLNRLRQKHARDGEAGKWFGVDVDTEGEILLREPGCPRVGVMLGVGNWDDGARGNITRTRAGLSGGRLGGRQKRRRRVWDRVGA